MSRSKKPRDSIRSVPDDPPWPSVATGTGRAPAMIALMLTGSHVPTICSASERSLVSQPPHARGGQDDEQESRAHHQTLISTSTPDGSSSFIRASTVFEDVDRDVDQALVGARVSNWSRAFLSTWGPPEDRVDLLARRERDRPTHHSARRLHGADDFLGALVDQGVVVRLELDPNLLVCHEAVLREASWRRVAASSPPVWLVEDLRDDAGAHRPPAPRGSRTADPPPSPPARSGPP